MIGNLHSTSIHSLIVVIGMAGWLIGTRHAVIVTLLSIGGTLGIALALEVGLLQTATQSHPLTQWVGLAVLLTVTAIFSRIIARAFRAQLGRIESLNEALARQVAEVRADESQLRLVTEHMPAMIIHNRGRRCLYANAQYAAFAGRTQKDLVGLHVRELVGEAAYTDILPYLERVEAGEKVFYRRIVRRPDREEMAIEVELVPERGAQGEVIGYFAMVQDITARLRQEAALVQSEGKFSKVFKANPLPIAVTRLSDGRFLDINEAWCQLSGWAREETIGRTSLDLQNWRTPEDRAKWTRALRKHGRVGNLDTHVRMKDGTLRDVLLSAELIDLEGEPCALVMANDISERKRAEVALRRSEDRFSRIFQDNPIAISLTRFPEGTLLEVNPAFVQLCGWPREELIGRATSELRLWSSEDARRRWISTLQAEGRTRDYIGEWRKKTGELVKGQISAEILQIGGEDCLLSMIVDLTDRLRAEETLRASEARLADAQRIGHIGSWELDLATMRIDWSDELFRIYETDPAAFGGTWDDLLKMVHPDDMPVIRKGFRESAQGTGACEIDHRIITPGGRLKHLHVKWQVIFGDAGKPASATGTAQDVTEQVLARAEIERLNA
ncbi:MAG: PAS domain S-box protein, partial [Burkholderiaceae bacterium]|nr:PAS domain S-box protein [Burkholderiaceae bacterium]